MEAGSWKPLLHFLHPLRLRGRARAVEGKPGPGERNLSLQHVVLILWLLVSTAFGPESVPILGGNYPGPYFTLHVWIFTLSNNICCTELRHRIASQLFRSPIGGQSNSAVFKSWRHQKSICNQLPPSPTPPPFLTILCLKMANLFFSLISL